MDSGHAESNHKQKMAVLEMTCKHFGAAVFIVRSGKMPKRPCNICKNMVI